MAVCVYISFKYLIPNIAFENIFYKMIAQALPGVALFFSIFFILMAAMSAFYSYERGILLTRQKDIATLRSLSWRDFEKLVGEAFRRDGYSITETGGAGADGGVDLVLKKNNEKILVQCKHWKTGKVGVKIIRELYGVVVAEGATGGIVISSGIFTREASNFAKNKPLELIGGRGLLKIIADVQGIKVQSSPESETTKFHTGNICPQCKAPMVLRIARKGFHAGKKFWGCSNYPRCRSTKPYYE